MSPASDEVVDRLFRRESGRAVATLIRAIGDFDLAEEAVQDAFVTALERWPADGVPDNPGSLDHHHGPQPGDRPLASRHVGPEQERDWSNGCVPSTRSGEDMPEIPDDRLRLIFTCCHPALPMDARVALDAADRGRPVHP